MNVLSSKGHGILDYITVLFLALSPSLLHLASPGYEITYALAFIHLCLTLLTNFELGAIRLIPLWLHGTIELFVSICLLIATLVMGIFSDAASFYFYLVFSLVLFFVWVLTDYTVVSTEQ